jgi:hypothetical protein
MFRLETTSAAGAGNCYFAFNDASGVKGRVGYLGSDDTLWFANLANADINFYANGATRMTVSAAGVVNVAAAGKLTINNLVALNDAGGTASTIPVGGMIAGTRVGAGTQVGMLGTATFNGTNYVQVQPADGTAQVIVSYGTWRCLGNVNGAIGIWIRTA